MVAGVETMDPCAFDTLFSKSVPHILEKIFFSLDYASFKNCFEVCSEWNGLLTTKQYQRRGKLVFHDELKKDGEKLWHASIYGRSGEVRTLLVSRMLYVDSLFGRFSSPPLHIASCNGHADVVHLLLDGGADPNMATQWGSTPLMCATKKGHKDVVKLLLDRGAQPT